MDRNQWLEWRRGGIGSSDAAVIMNVSPWKTKCQLSIEKIDGVELQKDNPAMAEGRRIEPIVREELEEELGMLLEPRNVVNEVYPWLRASVDAISFDGKHMFEIKNANKEDHELARKGIIPEKYFPQCQHLMLVLSLENMKYVSHHKQEKIIVFVKRDHDYTDELFKEESKFWHEYILKKIYFPKCDRDLESMEGNEEWISYMTLYLQTRDELKELEEKESNLKASLISLANGKMAKGAGGKLCKSECKGKIDYEAAYNALIGRLKLDYRDFVWVDDRECHRKSSFTKWTIRDINES